MTNQERQLVEFQRVGFLYSRKSLRGEPTRTERSLGVSVSQLPGSAWTPNDFADAGPRTVVDKALQRLATSGELEAIARRDHARVLIDGRTAANDLGLTTAVPATIEVFIDARLRPIRLGTLEIRFRPSTPSRLHWAGRLAMRIVQALPWLRDSLDDSAQQTRVTTGLQNVLANPEQGLLMRTCGWAERQAQRRF